MPRTTKLSKQGNGSPTDNDPEAVARRAYEIYERRGGSHGADLDDWLQAERELKRRATDPPAPASELTPPAPARPRRRKTVGGTGL